MEGGASVTHVNPHRVSLEELFVREAAEAGGADG